MRRLRPILVGALLAAFLLPGAQAAQRRIPPVPRSLGIDLKVAPAAGLPAVPAASILTVHGLPPVPGLAPAADASSRQRTGLIQARATAQSSLPDQALSQAGTQLFDGNGVRGALKDWFRGLVQSVVEDPAVTQERAKRLMPAIRSEHASTWRARKAMLPEEANGVTTARAIELLSRLATAKDPTAGARHVRNGTYFKSLPEGQTAVVKKVFTRTQMGESRVHSFTNDVRWEVLAFRIDRYLGTNLVPPTVRLSGDAVAELMVRAGVIGVGEASRAPPNLMEMSHLAMLDLLIGNTDREHGENLLQDKRGKIIGIDFDLSRPSTFAPIEAFENHLHVSGVLLEPQRRFWGRGLAPGVFSRRVLARLKALDSRKISELSRAGGVALSDNETRSLLSSRSAILQSIENLKARYGAGLILLP